MVRGWWALVIAAAMPACALGLDFDSVSNECLPPRFDLPTAETFCSGELVAGATYLPPNQDLDADFTLFPLVASSGPYVATAALGLFEDDRSCVFATPGLDVARLGEDGSLTHVGGIYGRALGLSFVLGGCEGGLDDVWPVELAIFDTEPLVHVVASFAEAGLLEVWVDPGGNGAVFYHHIGGNPDAPTRRECLSNACVTSIDEPCVLDGQCHPGSYCREGGCQPFEACTVDVQCNDADRLTCATPRGTCALECETDLDCPHLYACSAGVCGGRGCSATVPCVGVGGSEPVCVEGACLTPCSASMSCSTGESCFPTVEQGFVCAPTPGGRIGGCYADSNCSLGAAYGFTETPRSETLSFDLPGILLGTLETLRLAVYIPAFVAPFLTPPTAATQLPPGSYTDLVYVDSIGSIYIALAAGVIVRYDWNDITAENVLDSAEYTTSYPIPLEADARLSGLRQVGGYLVTLEAAAGGFAEATQQYARALVLDANADTDLSPLFGGVFALGPAIQSTFGTLPNSHDTWVFGLDRDAGGELIFYDMSDPAEPVMLGTLPVGASVGDEPSFVNVTEAGIFVTDLAGVTPYVITLEVDE